MIQGASVGRRLRLHQWRMPLTCSRVPVRHWRSSLHLWCVSWGGSGGPLLGMNGWVADGLARNACTDGVLLSLETEALREAGSPALEDEKRAA